jgi:hypothetical protein
MLLPLKSFDREKFGWFASVVNGDPADRRFNGDRKWAIAEMRILSLFQFRLIGQLLSRIA